MYNIAITEKGLTAFCNEAGGKTVIPGKYLRGIHAAINSLMGEKQ